MKPSGRSVRGAVLALGMVLAGCQLARGAPQGAVQAQEGRESGLVRRVASLAPSATEILFAVGAADLVVGVSRQCDFPVSAKLKAKVGDFNRPDLARLAAVGPDLVLFTEYVRPEDLEALEQAGIRSLVLPAATLEDVALSVERVGDVTGRTARAQRVAQELRAAVSAVAARVRTVPDAERPRVYVEVDGPHRPYAVGPGSFMDDVIRVAGGRNAFAGAGVPYLAVSVHDVNRVDPEVILIDHPFQYKAGLAKREGWEGLAAVRAGRVYDGTDFDIILLNRPSPRIAQSLREVSRLLQPSLWNDDPR